MSVYIYLGCFKTHNTQVTKKLFSTVESTVENQDYEEVKDDCKYT